MRSPIEATAHQISSSKSSQLTSFLSRPLFVTGGNRTSVLGGRRSNTIAGSRHGDPQSHAHVYLKHIALVSVHYGYFRPLRKAVGGADANADLGQLCSAGSIRSVAADAIRPKAEPLGVPKTQTFYSVARYAPRDNEDTLPDGLPPKVASEIKSIDAMRRAIETHLRLTRSSVGNLTASDSDIRPS